MTKQAVKIVQGDSYKIGIKEVVGLETAMREAMVPLAEALKQKIYWSDIDLKDTEYKSRDGFIPYSDNCGGIQILEIVPKCEECEFDFISFGECNTPEDCKDECMCSVEGHLDAKLRIWLKFEGIENGVMSFYLVVSGGNADAPYFREKYSSTIFEASFQTASLAMFKKKAARHVAKVLELIK